MNKILPILSIILFSFTQSIGQGQIDKFRLNGTDPIVRFYPNPARTFVKFNFQKGYDKGYALRVYSFLGKKMYEASNVSQSATLDLAGFDRGVYIYQLFDKSGKMVESGKFQVSK